MVTTCCVPFCKNRSKQVTMHRFPVDMKFRQIWIDKIGYSDLKNKDPISLYNNYKVCDVHFTVDDHVESGKRDSRHRSGLRNSAIPRLFLPDIEKITIVPDLVQETQVSASASIPSISLSIARPGSQSVNTPQTPKDLIPVKLQEPKIKIKVLNVEAEDPLKFTSVREMPKEARKRPLILRPVLKRVPLPSLVELEKRVNKVSQCESSTIDLTVEQEENDTNHALIRDIAEVTPKIVSVYSKFGENSLKPTKSLLPGKPGNCCAFLTCFRENNDASVPFVKFPKRISKAVEWLKLCNREDILSKTSGETVKFLRDSNGICFRHYKEIDSKSTCPEELNDNKESRLLEETLVTTCDDDKVYIPMREYCAFINCSTHIRNLSVRKFRFPRDEDLLKQWTKAAGVPDFIEKKDLVLLFVCGKHFVPSHYTKARTLKPGTVPKRYETYFDDKATDKNIHWTRKERCTRKNQPLPLESAEACDKPVPKSGLSFSYLREKLETLIRTEDKPAVIKCCVKHCTSDSSNAILYKFPMTPNEYLLWIKAIENRAYISESLVICYRMKRICYKHFEMEYLINPEQISLDAMPTLHLVGDNDTQTGLDKDSSVVWAQCPTDDQSSFKKKIILKENSIEFPNLKRELKFGKGCQKRGVNKFPYDVYRLPYRHTPKYENIKVGHQLQIHTAIIVDDDDRSEKAAVEMVCDIMKRNEVATRSPLNKIQ